ncbi:Metabotropic glutamate receptor 8 [Chamberlinius hualienensis]
MELVFTHNRRHTKIVSLFYSVDSWSCYFFIRFILWISPSDETHATVFNICIAVSEKIARNAMELDFDRIIQHLRENPRARAVAIFVDEDNTRKLLAASIRANTSGHFLWIGSDSWGAKIHPVRSQETAAEGAITILPQRTNIKGFDVHFNRLNPSNNKRNIWFKEFWEMHFKCKFGSELIETFTETSLQLCQDNFTVANYEQEGLVPFVVDAVYSMAYALHNMIADTCGNDPFYLCDEVSNAPDGPTLLQYIRNVSFIGKQNREVKFNQAGDAYGSYDIFQYQKLNGKYDYIKIGNWSEGLYLNWEQLKWKGNASVPSSICSNDCEMGHHRSFEGSKCCWKCVPCRDDEYIFNDTCIPCLLAYRPSDDKTGCVRLPTEFMAWGSPWAIIPITFASFGIVVTLLIIAIFMRYNSTPVIMASGRELCYVLLIGIFTCYGTTFVLLAKPTTTSCTLLRICLGLCLSICYSAIFTKTNRISRIFNRGVRSVKRPSYTSPRSQIVISLSIVAVQLFGSIAWLIMEEPRTKESYPSRFTVVLQCGISKVSLIVSLVYNMILIALCTLYAFKTRKIPENFNEAKYIGFSMYSTCIVWLAFIPIYFGTHNDYRIQIASICMCLSISATVALVCLFTPKLYIVLCQPYKNVRQGGQQSSGGGATGGLRASYGQSMKFNRHGGTSRSSPRPTQTNGDLQLTSPSAEESSMSIASISK